MAFTADLREGSYKNIRLKSWEKFKLDCSHCVVAKCVVGNPKLVGGHIEQYKTSETPKIDNIFIYLRFDYISVIIRIN
jgi:hypothetical protein